MLLTAILFFMFSTIAYANPVEIVRRDNPEYGVEQFLNGAHQGSCRHEVVSTLSSGNCGKAISRGTYDAEYISCVDRNRDSSIPDYYVIYSNNAISDILENSSLVGRSEGAVMSCKGSLYTVFSWKIFNR